MIGSAAISNDGVYRYVLRRDWCADDSSDVCFIMLNPSTADALKDDPTIRKCVGFAKRWGFSSMRVVNLFAYRATNPAALRKAQREGVDIIGPANEFHIRTQACSARKIVLAWGANATSWAPYARTVIERLRVARDGAPLCCLGLSKHAQPLHPLTLSYSTTLQELLT